jgi:hypothetical protein
MGNELPLQVDRIGSLIRTIRGQKVILDSDLARIYGVPTRVLNQAVKRNLIRFPDDFLFKLTTEELDDVMRSQFVTASKTPKAMRSQFVTAYKRNIRYLPYAFTENGAIMAANVLNSPEAVRMSVFVVRAFVQMRELLGSTRELARQLAMLEKKLTGRLDVHEAAIVGVLQRIMSLVDPPPPPPEPPRRRIGFR